jgi:hypothetical protein
MSWQLVFLVTQLALGAGLFLSGMRKAIYEYNTGQGRIWGGIVMMAVGALMLLMVPPMIAVIAPEKPV